MHIGIRGTAFKQFIVNILVFNENRSITPEDVALLTCDDSMEEYNKAFTSSLYDTENNYEYYEHVGDYIYNDIVVNYIYKRFPQLRKPSCVKIATVLVNNLICKKNLAKLAEELEFERYISTTNKSLSSFETRQSTLEDVFEAFFGCTSQILNNKYSIGYSLNVLYHIVSSVLDRQTISLKYEDIIDANTRLKETIDMLNFKNTDLFRNDSTQPTPQATIRAYEVKPEFEAKNDSVSCHIYLVINNAKLHRNAKPTPRELTCRFKQNVGWYLGSGIGQSNQEAQKAASQSAIDKLKTFGIVRIVPEVYRRISTSGEEVKKPEITEEYLIQEYGGKEVCLSENCNARPAFSPPEEERAMFCALHKHDGMVNRPPLSGGFDINSMFRTKFTSGIRGYASTLLSMFCRQRNEEGVKLCLRMGALVGINDSDGCSVLDVLFMGNIDKDACKPILKLLLKYAKKQDTVLIMQKSVYNFFFVRCDLEKYEDCFDLNEN